MNNCHNNYEHNNCNTNCPKTIQRIYYIGATGPTGPTGPSGPTTINIGTTTTGVPGTQASVTNSGTNQNVILDFVIPAGATGPTPRLF